ncbi:1-(5-phosphoribosyl)-5-[(5-phosphoribosylamino)methylideneamino]imidazole-4-carboxamide isomerase [Marinigracilibium pacificum]|uniref:1-(5-phosphoribosyl)-5-[(5-phosphoribosylamino)methylideneamino] imidazole-4-carboxamide isomerase n=1 Tax=Marinigracilibium pacificum TaxID=2729599 RepID=A0A848JCA5_9BACT|nr:1-(5-phosphoribosyl)-5-[(5-phosphoribosylamino)methylideneamino]imidazole-4-carboxamide isomerase [Marinigracilibium pacificum]NMM50632.1 1-(5-phosphoribosyl)-5-[(5-phosphoribosylamino)methylideneamino]imidazole-4-carboxamide isomerase [Marinigracilibium pacificum]
MTTRLIPAIDIIEGKCVRLTQGDYGKKKVYNEKPEEVAKEFLDHGLNNLHLVDLDGARNKQIVNLKVLEKIASLNGIHVDFGGGIKRDQDVTDAFNAGAAQITGGSIAAKEPETFLNWVQKYGSEKIILGADARDKLIAVSGWEESSDLEVTQFIKDYASKGVSYVICTDVAKDGLLQGPSFDLYKEIMGKTENIKLIASGGVSGIEDIQGLIDMKMEGIIIGKAIYENKVTLSQLSQLIINTNA